MIFVESFILLIVGFLVVALRIQKSNAMAKIAPMGQSVVLEGTAHMAPMTHPDDVASTLVRFIQTGEAVHV